MNFVHLIGRLGGDPETKTFDNGSTVTSFSLATSSTWKDKNGNKQERTEWHNVQAWGAKGEVIAKYLTKGSQLGITGELRYNKWEDQNGNKRTTAQVSLSDFTFIGGGKVEERQSNPPKSAQPTAVESIPVPTEADGSDLPF